MLLCVPCGGTGTLRRELFDRLLIVSEHHLRHVLTEHLTHYNSKRPHRALGQLPPVQAHIGPAEIDLAEHRIRRKQILGDLISEYQIAAWYTTEELAQLVRRDFRWPE